MRGQTTKLISAFWIAAGLAAGCGDGESTDKPSTDLGTSFIRGRVTDVRGAPLANLEVSADGATVRTNARGRFELPATAGREVRMLVNDPMYTRAEMPVSVAAGVGAQVEVAVKSRRVLSMLSASAGGRVESDDGFAVELPSDALIDQRGAKVTGAVEVRYATITEPSDITAAPGRMQTANRDSIEGYGLAEVSFYQSGARLTLTKAMKVEVPLSVGHGLTEGQDVDTYQLSRADSRWAQRARSQVRGSKVVVTTSEESWVGAASALPTPSCMKGTLGLDGGPRLANTTIRAARARGLSLIQAETHADGSFCMPVSPDDDWSVSAAFDDGQTAYGLAADLRSDEASGMCGGTGCKDIGSVTLPIVE